MKNRLNIFLIAAMATACTSTSTGINAQNNIQNETRTVNSFRKIAVSGEYTVYLTQGDANEVRVETGEGMMAVTETVVKDGVLHIRINDSGKGLWQKVKKTFDKPVMNVYITTPSLDGISLSGSGYVLTRKPWKVENLTVALDGAGKIDLELETANTITADLSGAGRIALEGFAETIVMNAKGSGEIYAYDLDVEKAVVNGSGSTKCTVDASKELIVNLKNYAQVSYRGEPGSVVTTTKNKATVNQIK